MPKANAGDANLQQRTIRLARLHFVYAAAVAAQIIIFDSWQLITPTTVLQRWVATAGLIAATSIIWYFAHVRKATAYYRRLLFSLITVDIALASFAIYNQRGMASRAVFLFIIPIVVAAALKSRSAIYATAILCIAAYVTAAVSYFVLNFNEGYRIELYGEVGFYSAMFLITAGLISSLTNDKST